ncbi:hypothetical protein [Burkholderia pseudomallei]|uniref:hypothetical protein n=1 Tax=Burkholderia pseudomallei TaxID=28450 RepID=UPI000A94F06D|nr:hypothetical protein [Burkholderia pseudomallei]MBM5576234.1 hypothetical protein [Burkholderia pseudomallei]MBM5582586.1 hypothetical protein [Burkholderia pseudomallei]RPA06813.1 hypothetical protein EGT86_03235 [Burkholderia pseudomallei]
MSSAWGARLKAGDPRGGFPFGGMNGRRRCRCPMSIRHADAGFTAKKSPLRSGLFRYRRSALNAA